MTTIQTTADLAGACHLLAGQTLLPGSIFLAGMRHTPHGVHYEAGAGMQMPTDELLSEGELHANACRALNSLQTSERFRLTHLALVLVSDQDYPQHLQMIDVLRQHAAGHELTCELAVERRRDAYRDLREDGPGPWGSIELTEEWVDLAAQRGPLDETPVPAELMGPPRIDRARWEGMARKMVDLLLPTAGEDDSDPAGRELYRKLLPILDQVPHYDGLLQALPLMGADVYRAAVVERLLEESTRRRLMDWAALAVREAPGSDDVGMDVREDPITVWCMGALIERRPDAGRALQFAIGLAPANGALNGMLRTLNNSGPIVASLAMENAVARVSRDARAKLGL